MLVKHVPRNTLVPEMMAKLVTLIFKQSNYSLAALRPELASINWREIVTGCPSWIAG